MKRSTIREGGGKRLQAVVADGEKAKSKQRVGDVPPGSCKRNKDHVTNDVSIRTLASSLLHVLGLPKTPVFPTHVPKSDQSLPPQLLSSGLKDFTSNSARVPVPSTVPPLPNFPLSPTLSPPHPFSTRLVPSVRLCNSPSIPQPCLSSPGGHLSLQAPSAYSSADPASESQPSHRTRRKQNSPSRLYLSLPCYTGSIYGANNLPPPFATRRSNQKTPWRRGNGNTPFP